MAASELLTDRYFLAALVLILLGVAYVAYQGGVNDAMDGEAGPSTQEEMVAQEEAEEYVSSNLAPGYRPAGVEVENVGEAYGLNYWEDSWQQNGDTWHLGIVINDSGERISVEDRYILAPVDRAEVQEFGRKRLVVELHDRYLNYIPLRGEENSVACMNVMSTCQYYTRNGSVDYGVGLFDPLGSDVGNGTWFFTCSRTEESTLYGVRSCPLQDMAVSAFPR